MKAVRRILLVALLITAALVPLRAQQEPAPGNTVILISLDGMKGDYVNAANTPFLEGLKAEAVCTAHSISIFPSLTFPNHTAIATGCTADKHGIVSNNLFDAAAGKETKFPSDTGLIGRKPLWVRTEECGVKTALDQWPVSYGEWQGKRPSFQSEAYDDKRKDDETVDKLLAWLKLPAEQRPRFLMAYFHGADHAGHTFGPDSPEIVALLKVLDGTLKRLVDGIRALPEASHISLLIVTDHGMANIKKMINLQALWERDKLPGKYVTSGPLANIFAPEKADQEKILASLATVPELTAARTPDLPAEYHYNCTRAGDIVAIGAEGMTFQERARSTDITFTAKGPKGMHGYPPQLPSMHGFFLAWGAGIKKGVVLEKSSVLDVYPTVCALLGIAPEEVDGHALTDALADVKKN